MGSLLLITGTASLAAGSGILAAGWSDGGELGALVIAVALLLGAAFAWARQLEGSVDDPVFEPTDQGFRLIWRRCVPAERAAMIAGVVCLGQGTASLIQLEKIEAVGYTGAALMLAAMCSVGLARLYRGRRHTALELIGHVVRIGEQKTVLHRPRRQVVFLPGAVGIGSLRLELPRQPAVGLALVERLHELGDLQGSRAEVPSALQRE